MSVDQSVSVKIFDRGNADKNYDSSIVVHELGKSQQLVNGFKALGLCWLIGIGCVAIPVMHFFLVPGMAVVGIFMFFRRRGLRMYRPAFEIACPSCWSKIQIKAAPFNWPIREMCLNCRADAVIENK